MKKTLAALSLLLSLSSAARALPSASPTIPSGYRGVALSLPWHQLAFVRKGDRVDVMLTFDAQIKAGKEKVTATILQNVVVLDVQRPEKQDGRGLLELIVNPNEAQYLALSAMQGELAVGVRAPDDTELKPMEMASLRKLFR